MIFLHLFNSSLKVYFKYIYTLLLLIYLIILNYYYFFKISYLILRFNILIHLYYTIFTSILSINYFIQPYDFIILILLIYYYYFIQFKIHNFQLSFYYFQAPSTKIHSLFQDYQSYLTIFFSFTLILILYD